MTCLARMRTRAAVTVIASVASALVQGVQFRAAYCGPIVRSRAWAGSFVALSSSLGASAGKGSVLAVCAPNKKTN